MVKLRLQRTNLIARLTEWREMVEGVCEGWSPRYYIVCFYNSTLVEHQTDRTLILTELVGVIYSILSLTTREILCSLSVAETVVTQHLPTSH